MSAGVLRTGLSAHEILTLCRIRARIRALQASFDYILIDAPRQRDQLLQAPSSRPGWHLLRRYKLLCPGVKKEVG
jgi:hypothetical protein